MPQRGRNGHDGMEMAARHDRARNTSPRPDLSIPRDTRSADTAALRLDVGGGEGARQSLSGELFDLAAEEFDRGLIELRTQLVALRRAGNVAHGNFDSTDNRLQADGRLGREAAQLAGIPRVAPLVFGDLCALASHFSYLPVDRIDQRIGVLSRRQNHPQFVPEPLTACREIEEMAFDRVTVGEGDATSGRMAGIGPIAGLEQNRVERPDLNDFPGHAVDFHPIAQANSVPAHEHEPTDESDDQALQRNGQARSRQSEERSELARRPEDHEQNQKERAYLRSHPNDGS